MIQYYGKIRTENEFDGRTTKCFFTEEEAKKATLELLRQYTGIGYSIKTIEQSSEKGKGISMNNQNFKKLIERIEDLANEITDIQINLLDFMEIDTTGEVEIADGKLSKTYLTLLDTYTQLKKIKEF